MTWRSSNGPGGSMGITVIIILLEVNSIRGNSVLLTVAVYSINRKLDRGQGLCEY